MNTFKKILNAFWQHVKVSFQQAWREDELKRQQMREHRNGVNPSTGMPMISKSIDAMGTPFGLRDLSNRNF